MSSRGKANPHDNNNLHRIALIGALRGIAEPVDLETEPLWKETIWRLRLAFHRHVIGEFWRDLDEPHAENLYLIDRFIKKDYKDWVKYETRLWIQTWLSLEKIAHISKEIGAPEQVFIEIIKEMKFFDIGLTYYIEDAKIPSGKELIRTYQKENKALQNYENPFKQEDFPETFRFIGLLMNLAQRDNEFNNKYYKKIIFSRRDLQGFLEDHNPQRYLTNPYTKQLEKYHKRTPNIVRAPNRNPF